MRGGAALRGGRARAGNGWQKQTEPYRTEAVIHLTFVDYLRAVIKL